VNANNPNDAAATENGLLSIGAFAQSTGLSIAALRHYDDIELLTPALVDPDTGYRRYAPEQLDQARLICGLRGVDLPIDEIRAVLGQRPAAGVQSALDAHRLRLVAQLREVSQRVRAVDELIGHGAPMPALQAIRPVQLRITVPGIRAAAAFYTTAFDVVFSENISSLQFGTYRSDRFFLLTLQEPETDSAVTGRAHFGLLVDDVDAAHDRALAAGAAEACPPTDFAWKPRTSSVHDPGGNRIDLSQS
jgi:DNA-binding transcriptional MerR regulator